jgi:plastocyanin
MTAAGLAWALAFGVLVGCGGEPDTPKAPPTVAPSKSPFSPALATATIRVKALVAGTPPKVRNVDFSGTPLCGDAHPDPVPGEAIVAKDGLLANVIVYLSKGSDRWTYAPAMGAATLDQKGCMYVPHVFTVMVDQPITIRNSDPLMHNVHATPGHAGDEFNRTQQAGAGDLTMKFTREEVGLKVKCDVHSWMGARVGVFAHPFHGVTGADGSVTIRVPPGEYEVSAWHEYEKWPHLPGTQKVTVAGTETKEIEFVYAVK